jgi:hypothetical protein
MAIPAAVMMLGACWRMFAGLCTSAGLMILASIATAGTAGFGQWMSRLKVFGSIATSDEAILRRTKYVDLNSFFTILLGGNGVARGIATLATCAALAILAWTWWRSRGQTQEARRALWAATLVWTLMINIYVPVYDTILLVPAAALLAHSLVNRGKEEQASLQLWMALLWLLPWLTQSSAEFVHFQIFTVLLAGFGYWALTLARDTAAPEPSMANERPLALESKSA